jgi:hypothetical protein
VITREKPAVARRRRHSVRRMALITLCAYLLIFVAFSFPGLPSVAMLPVLLVVVSVGVYWLILAISPQNDDPHPLRLLLIRFWPQPCSSQAWSLRCHSRQDSRSAPPPSKELFVTPDRRPAEATI